MGRPKGIKNFSEDETNFIKEMANNGLSDGEIRDALYAKFGRPTSVSGVCAKRLALGIKSPIGFGANLDRFPVRKSTRERTDGGFRQKDGGSAKIAVMFPEEQFRFIDGLAKEMNVSFASAVRLLCERAAKSMTVAEAAE